MTTFTSTWYTVAPIMAADQPPFPPIPCMSEESAHAQAKAMIQFDNVNRVVVSVETVYERGEDGPEKPRAFANPKDLR